MCTPSLPPCRLGTFAGRGLVTMVCASLPHAWAVAGNTTLGSVVSGETSVSGPWLLITALLALGVVAALAGALGFVLGRRPTAPPINSVPSEPLALKAQTVPTQTVQHLPVAIAAREALTEGTPLKYRSSESKVTPADEGLSFSYTVSHDLRAPVRVVDGFARILKEDYSGQLDRIGNDHLDRILSAAARMNAMIDAMLSLAQLSSQPLARQPVNLSQIAGYIMDELRRAHPERSVVVEIEPDLQVMGDPTLMRLVLENLLSNAWKYTGRTDTAKISLCAQWQEDQQVFEVRDNGAGFDMRSSERLFGLFQRLHSANDFPGTGVGLASVQRIVRRHGGEIWAESAPGEGARFRFTIRG